MVDHRSNATVREELAGDRKRRQRPATVYIDLNIGVLVHGLYVLVRLAGQWVERGVAHCSAVSASRAVADELERVLFADAVVLARARVAPVGHAARIEHDLVLAAVLLLGPVGGQLVVAVDGDAAHAAHKAGQLLPLESDSSINTT